MVSPFLLPRYRWPVLAGYGDWGSSSIDFVDVHLVTLLYSCLFIDFNVALLSSVVVNHVVTTR